MTKLWQLKNLRTNEEIGAPQVLPESWEGLFGLHNFRDRLSNLQWVKNPSIADLGWFETELEEPKPYEPSMEEQVNLTLRQLLSQSDWSMLPDVPMTNSKKSEWIEYRRALRELKYQSGFPDDVIWPGKPE